MLHNIFGLFQTGIFCNIVVGEGVGVGVGVGMDVGVGVGVGVGVKRRSAFK